MLEEISEAVLAGTEDEVAVVEDKLATKLELMYEPIALVNGVAVDCPAVPGVMTAPVRAEVMLPETSPLGALAIAEV